MVWLVPLERGYLARHPPGGRSFPPGLESQALDCDGVEGWGQCWV